jgi:hypothetical protein
MVTFLYPETHKTLCNLTTYLIEGAVTVAQLPLHIDKRIIFRKPPGNVIQKPPYGKIKLIRHDKTSNIGIPFVAIRLKINFITASVFS